MSNYPLVTSRLIKHIESLGWTRLEIQKEIPFLVYSKGTFPRLRVPVDSETPDFGECLRDVLTTLKEFTPWLESSKIHVMLVVDDTAQADPKVFFDLLANAKSLGFTIENILEQIGVVEGLISFENLYRLSKVPHVHSVEDVAKMDLA